MTKHNIVPQNADQALNRLIEGNERFINGIRSVEPMYSHLKMAELSENGQKRLQIIRQSNDGFWLAEQDLLIRGSGDLFGTQQTGFKEFKLAKIPQHIDLLKLGQSLAQDLLQQESPVVTKLLRYWYCESQRFLKA